MEDKALLFDKESNSYRIRTKTETYYISAIDTLNPLGKGAFGSVYKATTSKSSQSFAIKQISKSSGLPLLRILEEVEISKKFNGCYNLAYAIDVIEDNSFCYIIMHNYEEGTLTKLISQNGIKSELESLEYLRQICYGLKYLHEANIIHRDLKTDNILVLRSNDSIYPFPYYLCIADFGLSKKFDDMKNSINVGTAYTRAPEVSQGIYDTRADIFSIGCILYKMLTGNELLNGVSQNDIDTKLRNMKLVTVKSKFPSLLDEFTLRILEGCLQKDPVKRLNSKQLFVMVDVETIYTKYQPLKLCKADQNQTINLIEYPRSIKKVSLKPEPKTRMLKIYKIKCVSIPSMEYESSIKVNENEFKNILTNTMSKFEDISLNKECDSQRKDITKLISLNLAAFENHLKNEHTRVDITALINKYYILVYTQLNAKTQNFLSMEQFSKSYSLAHLCISICSEFAKYIHQNISENDISNIINHDKKQTTMKRGSGSVNPHSRKKTAKNME